MSVVYGRSHEGREDRFGVSGYTHNSTFILFDRATRSLWYPLDDKQWTAISGPRRGETIPFISEPRIVTLGAWRAKHPNTTVLLGSKSRIEQHEHHATSRPATSRP